MATFDDLVNTIVEEVSEEEFHNYMGGSNNYKVYTGLLVKVLSHQFSRNPKNVEKLLSRSIKSRFEQKVRNSHGK